MDTPEFKYFFLGTWVLVFILSVVGYFWTSEHKHNLRHYNKIKGTPTKITNETMLWGQKIPSVMGIFFSSSMILLTLFKPDTLSRVFLSISNPYMNILNNFEVVVALFMLVYSIFQIHPGTRNWVIKIKNTVAGRPTQITSMTSFWAVLTGVISLIASLVILYFNLVLNTPILTK